MSDNLEQEEVSRAGRGRRPSTVRELFESEQQAKERGDVVLRKIASADGFERTVTCRPGMITVLPEGQKQDYKVFCDALLGRDSGQLVSMRYGKHQLHPSEIHTVITSNVIEPGLTVEDVLLRSGVAEQSLKDVAKAIGLESELRSKTQNLTNKKVARLSAAVAIWSKSRIVYLDAPFRMLGSEWAPTMAHLLLESVSDSNRVMIVGGVAKLPRMWKSSPLVEVAGVEVGVYDGDVQVVDETMGYLRKIQHLIGSTAEDDNLITTYPQRIFRRRTPSDSAMCIEAISNPNLTESEQDLYAVDIDKNKSSGNKPASRKRRSSGSSSRRNRKGTARKLTQVTRMQRLRRKSMVLALHAIFARNETRLAESPGLANYRIQQEEKRQHARQTHELMLLILILLMTVLLLLNWF